MQYKRWYKRRRCDGENLSAAFLVFREEGRGEGEGGGKNALHRSTSPFFREKKPGLNFEAALVRFPSKSMRERGIGIGDLSRQFVPRDGFGEMLFAFLDTVYDK